MRSSSYAIGHYVLVLSTPVVIGTVSRHMNLIDRYFIFFPRRELFRYPTDRGMEYEDVFFETQDGIKLHGWFIPGTDDRTILWFHGNAGNVSHRVDNLYELHAKIGLNVFIFDYRGYGKSEGQPSEKGTYIDGEAAIEYVRSREDVDDQKLVLFGRSLGCGVATEIAIRHDAYALILESPFTSILAMAKKTHPFLSKIGLLTNTRYDTLAKVENVTVPIMVLHGDRDDTCPFDMGLEIFKAAPPPKRFYNVKGASHNDTYLVGGEEYFNILADFLFDPYGSGN